MDLFFPQFVAASFSKTNNNDYTIADMQFYSPEYLSLLLLNENNLMSSMIQLPIDESVIIENHADELLSLGEILGTNWPKPFQGISARRLAVSGARKIAAVLNENNRKIRLLETEVEPDDDEDDDDDDDETGDDSLMDTSMNITGTST